MFYKKLKQNINLLCIIIQHIMYVVQSQIYLVNKWYKESFIGFHSSMNLVLLPSSKIMFISSKEVNHLKVELLLKEVKALFILEMEPGGHHLKNVNSITLRDSLKMPTPKIMPGKSLFLIKEVPTLLSMSMDKNLINST